MLRRILAVTAIMLAVSFILSCGGAPATTPEIDDDGTARIAGAVFQLPLISLIAFTRELPDDQNIYGLNNEIFIMLPDGSHEAQVTDDPGDDNHASFSPLGFSLAFVSNRASGGYGNHCIYRKGPLGDLQQLTFDTWQFDALSVDWGRGFICATQLNTLVGAPFDMINCVALHPYGNWSKYIDLGYGTPYDVTVGTWPNMFVYSSYPNGPGYFDDKELYLRVGWLDYAYRITYLGDEDPDPMDLVISRNPAFDKTGTKILFQTNYWDDDWEIALIDLNSADVVPQPLRLTNSPGLDVEPTWSPDGQHYAWVSDRDGNREIYKQMVYDPTTPTPVPPVTRLTFTAENEYNPDWSPRLFF